MRTTSGSSSRRRAALSVSLLSAIATALSTAATAALEVVVVPGRLSTRKRILVGAARNHCYCGVQKGIVIVQDWTETLSILRHDDPDTCTCIKTLSLPTIEHVPTAGSAANVAGKFLVILSSSQTTRQFIRTTGSYSN